MAGFTADWLALREPADARARDGGLVAAAGALLADQAAPHVCDLGAGTGAAKRAFGPHFPGAATWSFVDNDAETLRLAAAEGGTAIEADLARQVAPWPERTTLVTATALFDLAAAGWIAAFVASVANARLPLLASLTYDGRLALDPAHPMDADMIRAFNSHQRTDKGLGGPAAGPDAAPALAAALADAGYSVRSADTPWTLERGRDDALIAAMLAGWAEAAVEIGHVTAADAEDWRADRTASVARLTIGHIDILATPAGG